MRSLGKHFSSLPPAWHMQVKVDSTALVLQRPLRLCRPQPVYTTQRAIKTLSASDASLDTPPSSRDNAVDADAGWHCLQSARSWKASKSNVAAYMAWEHSLKHDMLPIDTSAGKRHY